MKGNGEHILVVDDEQMQLELATAILNYLGYSGATAASGEKALEYMKDRSVDLLILDMQMSSGMNGRKIYESILKKNPKQKAIIVSGYSESLEVQRTLELGACLLIKKPYTLEELAFGIKTCLTA